VSNFKAQYHQDKWVLKTLNNKRGGYFVECGAYGGVSLSNTYVLEMDFSWTGICIEPDSRVFKELQANRQCITDNSCVGSSRRVCKFAEVGSLGGIVTAYSAAHKKRVSDAHPDFRKKIVEKQMVVLSDVLDKHSAPRIMDLLSLDTEGSELAILRAFPFDRYAFRTMIVEHNGFKTKMAELRKLLRKNGYTIVEVTGADFYAVRKDLL
jgi:FkbM family methyltransferase